MENLNYKLEIYVIKDECYVDENGMPRIINRVYAYRFKTFEEAQNHINNEVNGNFVDLDDIKIGEHFYQYVLSIELIEDDGYLYSSMGLEEIFEKKV